MINNDAKERLRNARLCGEEKALEYGFSSFPIDPFHIGQKAEIEIQAKPKTEAGVSGMLLKHGNNFGILYATHIGSEGFQRFSIGHELGHFFLDGHMDAVLKNNIHESRSGFTSNNTYEMEADQFAVGLLMPRKLFSPALRKAGEGLAAIEHLAELCKTSLTSTAIRFTQCSNEPVAIIVSNGNTIDYCCMSDSMKEIKGINWLRKKERLSEETPTFAFNQDKSVRLTTTSDLQDWFGGNKSISINEDIINLDSYGKTLTVLHGLDINDEEEENDYDLVEVYSSRFRS